MRDNQSENYQLKAEVFGSDDFSMINDLEHFKVEPSNIRSESNGNESTIELNVGASLAADKQ